ncbi:MAG: glycosyltransferase family 2 protein [Desulfovibrionaceae bacterium]|nr:glycosyltransferase family 2 protein [Desulfovibrionaceae bacterium]
MDQNIPSTRNLISIVLPVYNAGKNIVYTIESLKKQLYDNIEIIIIDGSTDITSCFVAESIKSDDRFKLYTIKNRGPGYARNVGIKKSTGEYITFIDHDDIVSDKWISSLYNSMQQYSSDVAFCFSRDFNQTGYLEQIIFKNIDKNFYNLTVNIKDQLSLVFIPPWCKLVRRDFILQYDIHFSKLNYLDDVLYHFLVLHFAKSISFCHDTLYFHRVHSNSVSSIAGTRKDIFFHHFKTMYDLLIYAQRTRHSTRLLIRRYLVFLKCYEPRVESISIYNTLLNNIDKLIKVHEYDLACHEIRKIFDTDVYLKLSK